MMQSKTTAEWIEALGALKIGCGPINTLEQVFADPQVQARKCVVEMPHASGQTVKVIVNPVRISGTPAEYRLPPSTLGQHTDDVLREKLGIADPELADLRSKGII